MGELAEMFQLRFATNNAAFDGEPFSGDDNDPRLEIERILAEIAQEIKVDYRPGKRLIRDVNGNTIGSWELS